MFVNGLASQNAPKAIVSVAFRRTARRSKTLHIPLLLSHLQTAVRADSGRRA
jgi:hypothetical protein